MNIIMLLLTGMIIGWLTKIPFTNLLFKRKIKHLTEIYKNIMTNLDKIEVQNKIAEQLKRLTNNK